MIQRAVRLDEPLVTSRAGRLRRRARAARAALAGALLVPGTTGCYTYRTAAGEGVAPGTQVAIGITDRGRVALDRTVGEGVVSIEGTLTARNDSVFLLRVAKVEHIGGRIAKWGGESIAVPREHVSTVKERHLSRTRTWVTIGAVTAAVAGIITSITLNTFGREGGETKSPPDPVGQ